MLDLAAHIIETKTGTFDLSQYEDQYENALIDLIAGERCNQPRRHSPRTSSISWMRCAVVIAAEKGEATKSRAAEPQRTEAHETAPRRRAAAAASARDKVRKSPRSKKGK
jgi:DNA end-binding protein Ku